MNSVVFDTSVIVKSIFKPMKSLSNEIYKRELETHKKCREIIRMLEEVDADVDVYIPKICIVETAAVTKRLSGRDLAMKISKAILDSYEVVDEAVLFNSAWKIAIDTGCSGFDSYFIALARIKNAVLITDDAGMHSHAKEVEVNSVLVRETDIKKIESIIKKS
ncbi:putative nucleic acid-binding protein, contains PIN domain [Archaeoglobus sulfaticallidus PM70-1]|uniref:Putative nucleic acid-binding protein, contains PIN domain n=1 Tax=Archaeoglobus sulfaticallidus PM70-1 TaxID=387631 RepID=N0BF00_9EURY|nr:type II toxin-antitoxin system VapC family toxin [Archaeoglobus sulfaticallidus]AGK62234.1 putative nucleic acid-binding protein, contains PIN domain [Archaeoglobus sulfaticallidus PM70-1]